MAKKEYNQEEYIEKQEQLKEQLEQRVKELAEKFRDKPEQIVELLEFSSRFYKYSQRNVMLIYSQNEGATFVESFKGMNDKGYHVKKGQHGMKILVPVKTTLLNDNGNWIKLSNATKEQKQAYKNGQIESRTVQRFKVGTVFDISQTDCPIEDYPKLYNMGYKNERHDQLYNAVKEYAEKVLSCTVVESDVSSISLRGFYYPLKNEIHISDKLQDTEKLSTLLHELAHAVLHKQPNIDKPIAQIEFEADALSIMLQSKLGIEVTEGGQRHLANHFREFESIIENNKNAPESTLSKTNGNKTPDINTVLHNVSEQYRDMIDVFEETVSESLAQQNSTLTQEQMLTARDICYEQSFSNEMTML